MHPLDNAIWKALTSVQTSFGRGDDQARRFHPEVSLLGAVAQPSPGAFHSLAAITGQDAVGLVVDDPSSITADWTVKASVSISRMVHENSESADANARDRGPGFELLGDKDSPEMMELTQLTRPGPFGPRTHTLGTYIGIRQQGRLAAMAGERLRLPGYTEISAVCTHPDFLGRGYAGFLMRELITQIRRRREVPFLHVRPENERAIAIYKRLGFVEVFRGHYVIIKPSP